MSAGLKMFDVRCLWDAEQRYLGREVYTWMYESRLWKKNCRAFSINRYKCSNRHSSSVNTQQEREEAESRM